MTKAQNFKNLYQKFDVDPERGFLPTTNPILKLPVRYAIWDELAIDLTAYINAGKVREQIKKLPVLKADHLHSKPELERAMLLLSFFAHSFVNCSPEKKTYIPKSIAKPWEEIANKLGRYPVISHASAVLNNWRLLDQNQPIQLDNLATIMQIHGGIDESWFYLVTVNIEKVGAEAVPMLLNAISYVESNELDLASEQLNLVSEVFKKLIDALLAMYDHCDPYIFYTRVRPFLASFENVKYEGCTPETRNYHGGSAAQSSLLQLFDAALGMGYDNNSKTKAYLMLMRKHMPAKHAAFLEHIESISTIKEAIGKCEIFKTAYQNAVDLLVQFRNEHLKIVALYIMKQAKDTEQSSKGTGGTNPMEFLKSIRDRNLEARE